MSYWLSRTLSRTSQTEVGRRSRESQWRGRNFGWIPNPAAEYDDPPQIPVWPHSRAEVRFSQDLKAFSQLREQRGEEVAEFFSTHLQWENGETRLIWSIRRQQIVALGKKVAAVGVLQKVNNSRWINKYFQAVNSQLKIGGIFAGCLEDNAQRKKRILEKHASVVAVIFCWFDFVVHRVWPKTPFFNRLYFILTRGHNRPLSAAEVLGRLVSCGFEIIEFRNLRGLTYFAVRKKGQAIPMAKPTYGPVCALTRIGKGRREVTVYKLRTMHPYAEFLQEYLFTQNGTLNGDKICDDFRIAPWAGILRRVWLDELPMIINLLKGDLKLVGVRPLSAHKFSTYAPDLQELRTQVKPGLIPPCYVDMPETPEAFFESEERYLRAYQEAPFSTDVKYFFIACWNILGKRARSA